MQRTFVCRHFPSLQNVLVHHAYGMTVLAGEWLEKLQRYAETSELVIRPNPKNASDPKVAVQAEGDRVLKMLRPQVRCLLRGAKGYH